MNLKEFKELIENICDTSHYESDSKECPRQVYSEYSTNYEYASNGALTENTSINLNHYSLIEFDETLEKLKKTLILNEIPFNIETDFDKDTKVITNYFDIKISNEIEVKK